MDNQIKQLTDTINSLVQRVSSLEQNQIKYEMPSDTRVNVQRAVIAGTQYLGNLSGVANPVLEKIPSYLQLYYNGKLWNVSANAFIASGSGAPTFDAPAGTLYLRNDYTFDGTPAMYINQNGGTTWYGFVLNANIMSGAGVPALTAPKGTLYCNTSATTTTTRLYINTDGSNTWTNFTSAA